MPNQWDLTGENIENTYQRVLQTPDGVNIYDGTGSLFTVTAVASAGGSNTQIQFNSASALSGSSNFSFDYTNNNVILTGSILMSGSSAITGVDYIDFDTTASIATSIGRLHWNDVDGTLDLGLKGGNVTLQVGQEEVIRVVNKTGADLLESQYRAVRIRSVSEGGAQGQRLAVVLAQADNDNNSATTIGIVTENIAANQEGFITTFGKVRNIDTTGTLQGETWVDGDMIYLSPTTPGYITNIKPQAPQHTVILGYVVYAHQNNGKIFVKVDNGYEIDELHNVRITTASLTPGQLLVRSGSAVGGVWINSNQLTGSYGLTGSLNATLGFTGSLFGTASWADSASQALTASFYQETDPIFVAKSASLATTGSNIFVGNQVVSGSFIIETASSAAALRITQLGTGDAILVEDSSNPDTTPFVVAADGRVGIGVQTPLSTYKLHVRNGTVTNSSTWGGSVGVFENSGSNAYLSVLASDTYTAGIGFGTAAHRVSANLYWNSTTKGFDLATNTASAFLTFGTDTGTERMRITSGGLVGIGTTTPDSLLHVFKGSAGSVTSVGGTNVTIEDSSTNYLSMLAPDNSYSGIVFGSPSDSFGAYMRWRQTDTFLDLSTADSGDYIRFGAGNSDIKAYVTSTGFGVNKLPTSALDISGSAVVTGSVFLPSLTTTSQNNVVTVDITTGQLYYTASTAFGGGSSTPTFPYTGSAIISGSLTVTGSFFVSNSIDSVNKQLIDGGGVASVNWNSYRLYNSSNNLVVHWGTGNLYSGSFVTSSVSWTDRVLRDSDGTVTVDWENGLFNDTAGNSSLDVNNRLAYDSNTIQSSDWGNRQLFDDTGKISEDWRRRQLLDSSETLSIDWENRQLKDPSDLISMDYRTRQLFANDGSTAALDYNTPESLTVVGHLIPGGTITDNTSSYDLGSATAAWRDLYVSNGSINLISGSQSASISFINGALDFGTTPISSPDVIATASVSSNTITFTKGDGTTFPITVDTGSGGGGGGLTFQQVQMIAFLGS